MEMKLNLKLKIVQRNNHLKLLKEMEKFKQMDLKFGKKKKISVKACLMFMLKYLNTNSISLSLKYLTTKKKKRLLASNILEA